MRTVMLALVVAGLISCHSAAGTSEDGLKFRTLKSGSQARHDAPGRQIVVAPTAESYSRLWSSMVGEGSAPPVDFEKEVAVFIMAGQKPTGGYSVAVKSVAREDNTLVVDAPVKSPPSGAMTIQALTSPYSVIAVDKVDVSRVHWKDEPAP
jgi:hypothetical protein